MATTTSIVGTVSAAPFNNLTADDGVVARIRDGQTAICSNFSALSIPVGATIDGIEVDMEGYASNAGHDANVGDWIYVSNDGGSSFSTAQSVTTGTWSTNSGAHAVETAGGTSELWGETWNATTAAAIQVKLEWSTSGGDAVYLDYVLVRITYTEAVAVATLKSLTINSLLTLNGKLTIK